MREVDFASELEDAEGTLAEPLRDPAYSGESRRSRCAFDRLAQRA